ncbi:hypothetical protein MTP06_46190 [Streptomyces sp. PLM4]|nr:hypothetical protein MTP06_46190 [Streptomyces sp. PLM4]
MKTAHGAMAFSERGVIAGMPASAGATDCAMTAPVGTRVPIVVPGTTGGGSDFPRLAGTQWRDRAGFPPASVRPSS